MRKIKDLLREERRVYWYLENDEAKKLFTTQAFQEGFHYRDGATVKEREVDSLMHVHNDLTLTYPGIIGYYELFNLHPHAIYFHDDDESKITYKVNYLKYAKGYDDYQIK